MAEILDGKEVARKMTEESASRAEKMKAEGKLPTLAIVRVGDNPGDVAYERGAVKRAEMTGVEVRKFLYDEDVSEEELIEGIEKINADESIHGVLMFRPLPKHMDEAKVCEVLDPAKDMDGITTGSMAGVFMDTGRGYPPCTAEACMAILDHYGIDLKGKRVTVVGRSLVIGKPVAMMAMKRHATVTVLHSRTTPKDFADAIAGAEVVIAAIGRAGMIGAEHLGHGQVILDVGINVDEDGKLCGDVAPEAAGERASMLTPVPGGVGSVTTAILMKHVIEAAETAKKRS